MGPRGAGGCADRVVETHRCPPGGTTCAPPHSSPVLSARVKKVRVLPLNHFHLLPAHKVARSRRGSGGRRGLGGAAQREGARSRTGVPNAPHSRSARACTQERAPNTPSPPHPPAQAEAAHTAQLAGRHPTPSVCPAIPASPQHPGLAILTVPGAQSALSSAPGLHPRLASFLLPAPARFPLRKARLRDCGSSDERAERACARAATVVARSVCVCAGGPLRACPSRVRSCQLPCTLRWQQNP